MFSALNSLFCRLLLILACAYAGFGVSLLVWHFPVIFLFGMAWVGWRGMRQWHLSDAHGSARISSLAEIGRGGLLSRDGLILGRLQPEPVPRLEAALSLLSPFVRSEDANRMFLAAFFSPHWNASRMLRVKNYVHLATFAKTGAGKGVSVLIPNLLSFPGSCVVTDPKGELFEKTAEHRRTKLGHRIIRLDPFGICGPGSDTLNPLDMIDHDKDEFRETSRDLANMLIVRQGTEREPHWNDSAELILTALIAFVCAWEKNRSERNLSTVRKIASSRQRYVNSLEVMQKIDKYQGVIRRLGGLLRTAESITSRSHDPFGTAL